MAEVRTKISVAGFNDTEIGEGLQDFLAEFKERPWLANPKAEWDSERKLLLLTIETEGNDPKLEAEAVLDEVWDCVIAYFNFSSTVSPALAGTARSAARTLTLGFTQGSPRVTTRVFAAGFENNSSRAGS